MTAILFFLVLQTSRGTTTIPAPFYSDAACQAEARRFEKASTYWSQAICVRVETSKGAGA